MRTVGLREFQQHLHAQLKATPLTITVRGKPLYVVTSINANVVTNDKKVVTSSPVVPSDVTDVVTSKPQVTTNVTTTKGVVTIPQRKVDPSKSMLFK